MPVRLQRHRSKGWRKPKDAVIVSRGSLWGNPFKVEEYLEHAAKCHTYWVTDTDGREHGYGTKRQAVEHAIRLYAENTLPGLPVEQLRGRDLICWCPIGEPCHADLLLEAANPDSDTVEVRDITGRILERIVITPE